jgi:hypothetical protein
MNKYELENRLIDFSVRETQINLKMLSRLNSNDQELPIPGLIKENDELLAIMYRTIQTARRNS